MKQKMKGKKLIILIAFSILLAAIAVVSFSSKQTSFIRAITKSSKDLQYYDENTVFVLFTKYLDENQNVIAPTSVQTQTVDNLDYKIDIPQIDGYTPLVESLEGVLDQEGIEYLESLDYVKIVVKDNIYNIHVTITYDAAPSAYTVVYYEQNTDLNGYTEIQRETIGGTEGNYTGEVFTGDEVNLTPPEKEGFSINLEKTKYNGNVAAFGQTTFEIYYDRDSYYLYTFNTGDSYYEPIVLKYGQEINLTEEPTYSGYVFAGWEYSTSMDGEKIEKPESMPDYNIYAEAQWTRSNTHYTLSYYTQNPDDDGYTNIGTINVEAISGDNLKDEDQTELKTIIEDGFATVRGDTAEYYYYNEEKTLTENNNFDIVVEGKGITVVPIYFDRHVYNITLDFNDSSYSTQAEFVKNGQTLTGSYEFQARLDQNLLENWLIPDDVTVNPKSSSRTYYLRGWKSDSNSSTYVSSRVTLTSEMIENDADSERNIVYYAQWNTSTSSRKLMYMFESFDQETTTTSDTRRRYNGKYYDEAEEYSQTVYTTSSMSAKEITGVTNVGSQTSGSTYYFYYDRDILKITLYNMNNVHIEKELKYGQSLEEFIDEELNPEDFTLETPGTKDWIFEGWYQDSNYMMPMEWTNEDGTYKTITDNLVLYAKWSAPTYTITFNTNGGTWTETDSRYVKVDDNTYTLTVEEGESLVRPSDPTRTGYVASDWNYDVNSESVEYLFSDSQKVYSDITLDLQYEANKNIPYRVRYIEAQYDENGELIEDVSQYENIVELAPAKEVYNNAFGSTVIEYPLDIYDNENDENYFVVNLRHEELKLTSENIDDNEIYFLYAKNPSVPYTVYYVKYQEDENGNQIKYDYGDIPADDVLLDKKESVISAGYATEIAKDIDGWTVNGSYSQTIKLILTDTLNTMYFYYNENETGEYLVNFFFMNENQEYSDTPDYTYTSEEAAGKILYGTDFDKFTYENGPTEADYEGRILDLEKCGSAYLIVTTTDEISAMDIYFANRTDLSYTVKYQDEDGNKLVEDVVFENQIYLSQVTEQAPDIDGYELVDSEVEKTITIGANTNEIVFTYAKRSDLEYTVNYYLDGTTTQVENSKTVTGQVFDSVITEDAIDIEGYNKVDPTTQDITITTGDNIINFYYTKRTDLSYTVKYLEKDTNIELAETKTVDNQTFEDSITEQAIEIEGYDRLSPTEQTIEINVDGNEIIFYYAKRTDLSYTVKYLEQDTNAELANTKTVNNQTFKAQITEQALDIEGYDKVSPTEQTIELKVSGNEIIFYYTKRTDLSYTVKYLEQDTNTELANTKTVNNQTFEAQVTENAIDIEGYNKVDPTEQTIEIKVDGNEIIFYYTKRTDLSYTVKYLEQDTNAELANTKTVNNQIFKAQITEHALDIEGYDKVSPTEQTIELKVSGNEIIFYYTKRTDLNYTVKYLEQDTDAELAETKTVNNQTFESQVTENAIDIEGYNQVAPLAQTIEIKVDGNEIIFYYTKRTDLSYTVKYLEKDTNIELAVSKVVSNQTFEAQITEQSIEIEGYDRLSPTEQTIEIKVSGNEIIFYYAKRTDLSYTVKYIEQDTNIELAETKTVNNQTFKAQVTETAIDIDGYDKVNPTEQTIEIKVDGNEITFYYTKRTDLSYTVKYLEKDTNNELAEMKTVNDQTFEAQVTEYSIEIEGYDRLSPTEQTIEIKVSGNEIIFYYAKRTDLSYTVKYLEQDTNTELAETKTVNNQTYKAQITEQALDIEGYDKVSPTEQTIEIKVDGNEIIFYYTKRTDLSYTVKYLEQDTNKELAEEKIVNNQIFKAQVTEIAIDILGYTKQNSEETITIEVTGNEIIFYYKKVEGLNYTVNYYEEGTEIKVAPSKTVDGKTFEDEVSESAVEVDGYNKVEPSNQEIVIGMGENVINFYYTKRTDLSYRVEYYYNNEIDSTKTDVFTNQTYQTEITNYTDKVEDGYKFDKVENIPMIIGTSENVIKVYYVTDESQTKELSYTVEYYKDGVLEEYETEKITVQYLEQNTMSVNKDEINTQDKYEGYYFSSTEPEIIPDTVTTGDVIKVNYTIRTDLSYTVKYLEKDTNNELAEMKTVNDQTFKAQVTETAIDIDGYDKVNPTEQTIEIKVSGNEITFYYTKRTDLSYTVKYLEKDTNIELAETKTVDNQIFEDSITEQAIEIEGYDRLSPTEQTIEINVDGNEIIFYYAKRTDLSYTVKYLEKDTNIELAEEKTVSDQTFKAQITENAIDIEGYDKVDPTEQTIEIKVDGNEITFYYTKRTDLSYTVNYYEQGTENKVATSKTVEGKIFEEKVTESAIDIEGYNKVEPTDSTITIGTGENVINFYYTKRTDLSYTVKYLEKVTNIELAEEKTVNNQTFKDSITEQAKDIEGYDKVSPTEQTIEIEVSGNEIIFYYTKRTDLSYTVKYLEKDTNVELAESKTVNNQTFKAQVIEQAIEIDGYNKVNPTEQTIEIKVSGNEITFYYTKRTDLSYKVEYYYDGVKDESKTEKIENQTFGTEILDYTEKMDTGYAFDQTENLPLIVTTNEEANIIKVYYVADENQTKELSYTVEYYKDGVLEESETEKITVQYLKPDTMSVNKDKINTKDKYEGYYFSNTVPEVIPDTVTTGEVIKVNYTIRKDLNYTVKYLEKDTNNELAETKTVNNQTYKTQVTEQAIEIDGYDKVDPTEQTIEIKVSGNEITFYYTKRNDLGYTVKYIDPEDGTEIQPEKIVENKTFGEQVTEEAPDIPGYNKVNPEETITITTGENIIKFEYTKRTDLEYTVNYYEDGTTNKIADSKVVKNQTFKDSITENAIEIDGFNKKAPTSQTINIEVENNIIDFYYTRRTDLSYTVKYINQDDGTELKTQKNVQNQTFDAEITEEAPDIPGYYKVNSKETIKITTGVNVINFYYTTRTDLEYTIEYYYSGAKDDSKTEKYQGKLNDVVETYVDKVITGYEIDKVENLPMTITPEPENNIIKVYYKKIKYQYTVNYYYDGQLDIFEVEKLKEEYGNVVSTYEDKAIYGYQLERTENFPLTITNDPNQNIINVYYTAKNSQIIVRYLDKDTKEPLEEDLVIEGKVYEPHDLENDKKVIPGYIMSWQPSNLKVEFTEETQTFIFYYAKSTKVIVKYLEKDDTETNSDNKVLAEETIEGFKDQEYSTIQKDFDNYVFVEATDNTSGRMSDQTIEVYYYYTRQVSGIQEKHIDVKTDEIIDSKYHEIPIGDPYKIDSKEFEGYELVEEKLPENSEGIVSEEPIEVKYYYIRKAQVKAEYLDYANGEKILEKVEVDENGDGIPEKTEEKDSTVIIEGYQDDEYFVVSKDFDGYILLEDRLPENAEGTMKVTKDDNGNVVTETVVRFYYALETKVIEKHIDVKSNEVLDEVTYEGYEGKEYNTLPKEFEGYDLVMEQLPTNASGKMAREVIEVNYYYVRKASVRVEHIDKATGEIIVDSVEIDEDGDGIPERTEERPIIDIIHGHEGEQYWTSIKDFEDYVVDEENMPENATGTMEIKVDENGNIIDEIVVKYYYLPKAIVIEKHIDVKSEQDIELETVHEGYVGKEYKTEPKDFENYELVEEKYPENAEGVFTEETIVVKYYYIRKVKVIAEYIDEKSGEKLLEKVEIDEDGDGTPEKTEEKDSTVIIEGYEGDSYKTTPKEFEGYDIVEEKLPTNAEGTMEKEDIHIKYYYIRKAKVIVEYINDKTGEKLLEKVEIDEDGDGIPEKTEEKDSTVIIEGHEGDSYKTTPKEFEGYSIVKEKYPANTEGTMTKEDIYVKYYYLREAKVIVEHIDEKTGEKILETVEVDEDGDGKPDKTEEKDSTVIIEGHEGDPYKTTSKEFEDYELVKEKLPENSEGTMTIEPITVKYYYLRKAKVIVEYINEGTGQKILETVEVDENGDGKPDKTEDKDSTVVIEGYEGDSYKTTAKEFEGYELVKEKLPDNSEGTMTIEPITVKYYYLRKAKVVVEYIEEKTGEKLQEIVEVDENGDGKTDKTEEKDSTVIIEGYEGDSYKTTAKEFEGYDLVKEKLPDNSEGTMTDELITVKYYYVKVVKVITEHIDEKTGEKILETVEVDKDGDGKPEKTEERDSTVIIEGYEGDSYKTTPKELEGYDLVKEKLPKNSEGTIGEENITVKYYYIRKITVTAEYIDERTGKTILENVEVDENGDGKADKTEEKDSTIVIEGHEGDSYKTTPKEFEGYDIVEEKLPTNAEGTMEKEDIHIKYYYIRRAKVIVEYINKDTGEKFKEKVEIDENGDGKPEKTEEKDSTIVIEGHEGDSYKTVPKVFDGYKVVETTNNENGTMKVVVKDDGTVDIITYVRYYYSEKTAKVIVRYLERGTHKVLAEEVIKEGKPGTEYTTEAKNIELYTLDREPENKNGVMTEEDIIVTYYYYFTNPPEPTKPNIITQIKDKITNNDSNNTNNNTNNNANTNNDSNNNSNNIIKGDNDNPTISTGDNVVIVYTLIIIFIVFVNIVQIIISKRKKRNIKK